MAMYVCPSIWPPAKDIPSVPIGNQFGTIDNVIDKQNFFF